MLEHIINNVIFIIRYAHYNKIIKLNEKDIFETQKHSFVFVIPKFQENLARAIFPIPFPYILKDIFSFLTSNVKKIDLIGRKNPWTFYSFMLSQKKRKRTKDKMGKLLTKYGFYY